MNSTQLLSDAQSFAVDLSHTTLSPQDRFTSTVLAAYQVSYFGSHGSNMAMILLSVIGTLLIISVLGVCALACLHIFKSRSPPQCIAEKQVNSKSETQTHIAVLTLDLDDEGSDSSGPITTTLPSPPLRTSKLPTSSNGSNASKASKVSISRKSKLSNGSNASYHEPSSESVNISLSEDTDSEHEIRIDRIPKNSDSISPRGTIAAVGIHRVSPVTNMERKIPINRHMLRNNTDLLHRVFRSDLDHRSNSYSNSRRSNDLNHGQSPTTNAMQIPLQMTPNVTTTRSHPSCNPFDNPPPHTLSKTHVTNNESITVTYPFRTQVVYEQQHIVQATAPNAPSMGDMDYYSETTIDCSDSSGDSGVHSGVHSSVHSSGRSGRNSSVGPSPSDTDTLLETETTEMLETETMVGTLNTMNTNYTMNTTSDIGESMLNPVKPRVFHESGNPSSVFHFDSINNNGNPFRVQLYDSEESDTLILREAVGGSEVSTTSSSSGGAVSELDSDDCDVTRKVLRSPRFAVV